MEKTFVIAWKSKSEPRRGQAKKLCTREEAEALAGETNQDHPAFVHEPLNLAASEPAVIIHVDFQSAPEVAIPVTEEAQEAVMA